jgi:NAD(P)H-hydrate epimerase
MDGTLTRAQVRELDRRAMEEYGVPGVVLMENAGRNSAAALLAWGARGPIVICCGRGNNGGDGFVIARYLDLARLPVHVLLFADPGELTGDARIMFQIVEKSGLAIRCHPGLTFPRAEVAAALGAADWIVDALLGAGLTGPARAPLAEVIDLINASGRKVLAIDLPSGLDCDTGRPPGPAVRATRTVTLAALKRGLANPASRPWVGECTVVDIGVPRALLEQYLTPAAE